MEDRHALDDRIGKVQDYIHRSTVGNIHGVQLEWLRQRGAVFREGKKVDLMYVEGV